MIERTLLIVKPDIAATTIYYSIVREKLIQEGFSIEGTTGLNFTVQLASNFYAVHEGQPFFNDHVKFMASGKSLAMVLKRENAVRRLRELVGATDPAKAAEGTLRKEYGTNLPRNAFHASDSVENAEREIQFLFTGMELGDRLL